jgi:hypothetical protein
MEERPAEIIEEKVRFDCRGYGMEGVLTYPERAPVTTGCLLAPPHPALGGNFDNNVILAIARGWAARGMLTLRFNYRGAEPGKTELFDRSTDPIERRNLVAAEPELAEAMQAEVDAFLAKPKTQWAAAPEVELDEMRINQLRALGYVIKLPKDKQPDLHGGKREAAGKDDPPGGAAD